MEMEQVEDFLNLPDVVVTLVCVSCFLLGRLNKFLQYLTEAGFRVARTHFDPTGVRTDARLEQFKAVLTKYSVPTNTSAATSTSQTSGRVEGVA